MALPAVAMAVQAASPGQPSLEWTLSSCSSSAALGRWYGLAMVITCCRWWLDFPPAHAPRAATRARLEEGGAVG